MGSSNPAGFSYTPDALSASKIAFIRPLNREAEWLCERRHEKSHHRNLILVITMDLGLMIPTAPGFLGSFQFLCVIGLAIFGIGREEPLSFSILAHVRQPLFVTALALFFLAMMKIQGFSLVKKVSTS